MQLEVVARIPQWCVKNLTTDAIQGFIKFILDKIFSVQCVQVLLHGSILLEEEKNGHKTFCESLPQSGSEHVWPRRYLDPGVDAEQSEKSVHVYQSLSGLSVHCAQEVEREGELEEQTVHHHQVSHGHRTCMKATEQLTEMHII